ncbi:MAG TPA: hypothetical protein VE972_15090 [Conexibacter sp.]|nr:hypothetical protein [Conexibacter sp.]
MSKNRIALPDAITDIEVTLDDGGVKRIYRPVAVVRSVQRKIRRIQHELDRLTEQAEDLAPDELERVEDEVMRKTCDLINLTLKTNADDAPAPGDMLYEGYERDRVTPNQIVALLLSLNEAGAVDRPT